MSAIQRAGTGTIMGQVEPEGLNIMGSGERCGDTDRQRVHDHLSWSYGAGYIDHSETEARITAALKATDRRQLDQLTRDLPPLPEPRSPRGVTGMTVQWQRRLAHYALIGALLFTAIGVTSMIYGATGHAVDLISNAGRVTGTELVHSTWAQLCMFLSGFIGAFGTIGAAAWYITWEADEGWGKSK